MSRILLADDSPHAQRMGERILRGEGFEVVTVSDGEAAAACLEQFDPDLVLADVFLPLKSGYEICLAIKSQPRFRHMRVVLIAGALEPLDEQEVRRVQADAILKKPFEASVVVDRIRPLLAEAAAARASAAVSAAAEAPAAVDPERVRAAVTLALDASLPSMIDEITEKVLVALGR